MQIIKNSKINIILVSVIMIVILLFCSNKAQAAPTIILDDTVLSFDVPPAIDNGRVMVPLRTIFEAMGANVYWDSATMTATAVKESTIVVFKIGSFSPMINGRVQPIDVPGKIVNGRTLAPLRFVCEAFGGTVDWKSDTQTAYIKSDKNVAVTDTLYHDNGTISYIGGLIDGQPNGQGTAYYESGAIKSKGKWINGRLNGQGTGYYENGTICYIGEFLNGICNGQGTLYTEVGTIFYRGEWKSGSMTGIGTSYRENGSICYIGEHLNGQYNGAGTYYNENGTIFYSGQWVNGRPAGR